MPVKGCRGTLRTSAGTKAVACEEDMARLIKAMRGVLEYGACYRDLRKSPAFRPGIYGGRFERLDAAKTLCRRAQDALHLLI
jgi:hypothetical protein